MNGTNGFDDLKFLTADEVAHLLRVSRATIYRWAEQGILPSLRVGRIVRFNAGEVKAAIERGLDKAPR